MSQLLLAAIWRVWSCIWSCIWSTIRSGVLRCTERVWKTGWTWGWICIHYACMDDMICVFIYIIIYIYIDISYTYIEIRNPPNMILDMDSVQRAKQGSLMDLGRSMSWLPVGSIYICYMQCEAHWSSTRSFGELYFQHWNFQLPWFKGNIICEIWMWKKSHNSHLKCHQFLERMLGLAIVGLIVSPKGNLCWTWSKKMINTSESATLVESHVVLYYLILPLFFVAPESPATKSKSQPLGQSAWIITTLFSSPQKKHLKCSAIFEPVTPSSCNRIESYRIKVSYFSGRTACHFFIHQLSSVHR